MALATIYPHAQKLKTVPVIAPDVLNEIRDNLRLALDEIETGRLDFIGLRNAVRYQRAAINVSHRQLEKMRGAL